MNNKPILAVVAVVVAAAIGFGIYRSSTTTSTTGKVRIAVNMPLTGPITAWSGEYPNGFKMGLEDACKELGVDPSAISTDFQDNAGKPAQAATVVQKQMAAGFEVYMSGTSEAAKAVVEQIDPLNVPHFLIAFDPFLAAQNPNRLRILPNSKIEGPVFVAYAKQRKAKSVYIIHVDSAYANEEFGKIVEPGLKAAGMTVTNEAFEFGTKDYKTIALKAAQANPDLIFVCGYSFHLLPLIGDLRTNGMVKDGRVMGVMDVVDFLYDNTPKGTLEGLVFASPLYDIPGAAGKSSPWRERYQKKFGRAASYVPAYAYDNAWAIVRAYKQSGKVTVESLRAIMPFEGVTGEIDLDKDGDIKSGVGLARLSADGKVEAVKE